MENSKSKILSDLDISEKKIENSTKQCINTLNASQINRLQMEIVSSDNKVNSLRSFYEHKIDQLEFHKNVLKGNVMDLETKLTIIENEKNIKYQQMNNLSIEKINKFTELEEQLLNTSMEHEKLLMEKNQLTFKVKNLETQIASKFLFLEQKIDTLQKDNDSYQKNMLDNEAWIEKLQARLQNSQNVEVELKKAQFKIQELEFDLTAVRDGAAHGLAIQNQVERLKVFEFENKLLNEKYQLLNTINFI
ncbi:hypothetical protein A3Q56_08199 [Intoshia linei]|uniref:Uncharacterized protein n=1 Tax=Intoshia linei TaxID=1819745 RepID=A0A177ARR5_9BILA|nr:hypothetical protein A3Q56_08199 [Intoshia linei]